MWKWNRIWILALLMVVASPLQAQEWIYCPVAPEELARQCRQNEASIRTNQERLAIIGDQMNNPEIILAKVDRRPEESVLHYRLRVKQQQGVASPESNRWLPILGRYYDPEMQVMYVALDRRDYWRYVWERLAPDEDFARRTFSEREVASQRFKRAYFTGPGGWLAQWQLALDSARLFREQCCRTSSPIELPPLSD